MELITIISVAFIFVLNLPSEAHVLRSLSREEESLKEVEVKDNVRMEREISNEKEVRNVHSNGNDVKLEINYQEKDKREEGTVATRSSGDSNGQLKATLTADEEANSSDPRHAEILEGKRKVEDTRFHVDPEVCAELHKAPFHLCDPHEHR